MKKLSNYLIVFVMLCCGFASAIIATNAEEKDQKNGIEVTVKTDKDIYTEDDDIQVMVEVKNNNDFAVKDISVKVELPDEIKLKSGELLTSNLEIASGQFFSKTIIAGKQIISPTNDETSEYSDGISEVIDNTNSNDSPTSELPSDNTNNGIAPKTGDSTNSVLWIMLIVVSLVIFVVCLKYRKSLFKTICVLLCISMVVSSAYVKALAEETKFGTEQISVGKVIEIDGTNYEILVLTEFTVLDESSVDSDNDGVQDEIEIALGLDTTKEDTDDDGLSDYQELLIVGTDPKKYDTDDDGVSDSMDDEDEDGISNIDEIKLGTILNSSDSDLDGLLDGEEVYTYNTNPLLDDTDGDTLSDFEELKLGLDPTLKSTDGTTLDNDRVFIQTAGDEIKDPSLLLSDNWLKPTVSGNIYGDLSSRVMLSESDNEAFTDNRAILSDVIDLATSYTVPLTLTFSYDKEYSGNIKNLTIVSFDEENGLQLIDTHIDDVNKTISGEIHGSATYFVIDVDEFLKGLGIDVFGNVESIDSDEAVSVNATETKLYEYDVFDNDGNIIGKSSSIITIQAPSQTYLSVNNITKTEDSPMGKADIVFVVDVTGSMGSAINNVKNNINSFAETLVNEYNIDANFGLVEFQDITFDGLDSTIRHKNMSSNWFTNASLYQNEIANLEVGDGGDGPETPIDGLENARRIDWRNDSTKFVILITDAEYKNDNRYGIENMEEMESLFSNDGIIVSVISPEESLYFGLVNSTNGIYGYIYDDFSNVLLGLAEKIGVETNDGDWVFLDDFQAVRLAPEGSENYGDTDGDGIGDYEELGAKSSYNMISFISLLRNRYDIPEEMYKGKEKIDVYKYNSNPVLVDTDNDGYTDRDDTHPRKWDISDRDLAIAANISYSNPSCYTKIDSSDISINDGASVTEMKDWKVIDIWEGGAGFYALALKKDNNVIIAYRGSTVNNMIDAIDDWVFADVINVLTGISTQEPAAKAFASQILNNCSIGKKYEGCKVYICGHSLGGNLALYGSVEALSINSGVVERICTYNGLGMPNIKLFQELFARNFTTLSKYKSRFYDYEIVGDPVSKFEFAPDHKWYNIFDLAVTTGVGTRIVLDHMPDVKEAHSLSNFHYQLTLFNRPR